MSDDRYFIDERGGCIAVRDKTRTDPEYNGLHPDTEGVMQFWGGERVMSRCCACGHKRFSGWKIASDDVSAAKVLCSKLNVADRAMAIGEENPDE